MFIHVRPCGEVSRFIYNAANIVRIKPCSIRIKDGIAERVNVRFTSGAINDTEFLIGEWNVACREANVPGLQYIQSTPS